MAKRGFFTFAIGSAAMAACVGILQKKGGGVHVSVDVEPRSLGGETVSRAFARLSGEHAAENGESGENQSD